MAIQRNFRYIVLLISTFVGSNITTAQEQSLTQEDTYYKISTIPVPAGIALEIGGLTVLPDGRVAVSTRRGEVWLIENSDTQNGESPNFKRFAHGMHECLGIAYRDGSFYVSQRGELTRLTDNNGDDKADEYKTLFKYPLSGNYHEYAYGPIIHPNGDMTVTLNVAFGPEGYSGVPWRGWTLRIKPNGEMEPFATGMRSPAGIGLDAEGEVFYSDNQGDWVGSGRITHLQKGDVAGHPGGLPWATQANSTVQVREGMIKNTGKTLYDLAKEVPGLKPPAIWFPHGIMGNSTSGILLYSDKGKMGPFQGQLFVGDQSQSKIMRASLEKVNGVYQGACYPFREGFSSGVLRQEWANDGSMYVGMTSRGWSSTGKEEYGLQRLSWTGKVPFEMKSVSAKPDGFELTFTMPVDKALAKSLSNYSISSFTYKYHGEYGSPVINQQDCPVKAAMVSDDGLKVRLVVDDLRLGYVHEVKLGDLLANDKTPLLHQVAYYTLNQFPSGEKLKVNQTMQAHKHHAVPGTKSSSKKETPTVKTAEKLTKNKRVTLMPVDWVNGPDQTIIMGTKPGLKFDKTLLEVKAGSNVKLIFNNTDDMQHNFVIVMPGKTAEAGNKALALGLKGPEKNYIPDTPIILFHTNLIQPTSKDTIYFTAPTKPGDYQYVCTYPGHAYVMYGTLRVVN
jgi:glucose/arabinose dehydrogenase/azurin